MRKHLAFAVVLAYLWVAMISLGGTLFSHFILYPNIFHDVPRSLETAMEFMVVGGPRHFFRPVGALTVLTGSGAAVLAWNVKPARYWILGSLLIVIFGEALFSMLFFWPRNTILFNEGVRVHSADYLRQVAQEFLALHWLRVAMIALSPTVLFVGFLRLYRHRVLETGGLKSGLRPDQTAAGPSGPSDERSR